MKILQTVIENGSTKGIVVLEDPVKNKKDQAIIVYCSEEKQQKNMV